MDVVGVVQHHDGVTGTGKQAVANDYSAKISKAIAASNPVYADVIDRLARSAGLESESGSWSWCQRQNGTYKDCPISDFADQTDFTMLVATHNPSGLAVKTVELKVPHGNFLVEKLNTAQEWVTADASVICNQQ